MGPSQMGSVEVGLHVLSQHLESHQHLIGHLGIVLPVVGVPQHANRLAASDHGERICGRGAYLRLGVAEGAGHHIGGPIGAAVLEHERIAASDVEPTTLGAAIQHRGGIVPLFWLEQILGNGDWGAARARVSEADSGGMPGDRLDAIICHGDPYNIGLLVHRVIDIVQEELVVVPVDRRFGVTGMAVVADRITEVVDADLLRDSLMRFQRGGCEDLPTVGAPW